MCFSHQRHQMIFHCNLSDSKAQQGSRSLLIISNIMVWMVSVLPLISICSKPLESVLSVSTTIGITITYPRYFSLARSMYSSIFSLFLFSLCGPLERQNPQNGIFFLLIKISYCLLVGIKGFVCFSKSQIMLCI